MYLDLLYPGTWLPPPLPGPPLLLPRPLPLPGLLLLAVGLPTKESLLLLPVRRVRCRLAAVAPHFDI